MMLQLDSFYAFMESNFDYLLAVDSEEKIMHASQFLLRDCGYGGSQCCDKYLADVLTPESLDTFRIAMSQVRAGGRGVAIFTCNNENGQSITLRSGSAIFDPGNQYIFLGNMVEGLSSKEEWEKAERVKELACLYGVADWIEISESIHEFFTKLPRYLSPGMLYPEEVVVYSVYQGVEYGQKPSPDNHISVKLIVGNREKGEIQVGYLAGDKHELFPEEQKMLDEIGRWLSLALERKELSERLSAKQEEEAEYNRHLQELETEINRRTLELEEQKTKLSVIDSYLERVNKGWEESKGRLEATFEAIPDDVVLLDKTRKVIMTNRKDIETGGYCYKSMFGRERPCQDCRLARILREKAPLTLTMKHDDKYLEVHAMPVYNQEHEVDGILEFYRDITLEKTYEQQLQQADRLASLGQLVSGIGHEINNPNQFIRGNIKIIKSALEDMLPIVDEYQKSHPDLTIARLQYDFFRQHIMVLVDDMAHGSDRIKAIVEGLRTFVRKDEGMLVDNVDINTLIEASARLVYNQIHKSADIELDLSENIRTFTGNSQKIEQVLINLMVNAGEAMPDDRKGLITVRTREHGNAVVVEVEDNGKGIDEKTLKQIFDPFFTTKRAKGGTGLGLSIAYKIIAEHGGTIAVNSQVNVGTKFTITIPVSDRK